MPAPYPLCQLWGEKQAQSPQPASGGLRLLGGRSGGLQGRRRVFIADIVLFSLGSRPGLGPDGSFAAEMPGPTIVISIGKAARCGGP